MRSIEGHRRRARRSVPRARQGWQGWEGTGGLRLWFPHLPLGSPTRADGELGHCPSAKRIRAALALKLALALRPLDVRVMGGLTLEPRLGLYCARISTPNVRECGVMRELHHGLGRGADFVRAGHQREVFCWPPGMRRNCAAGTRPVGTPNGVARLQSPQAQGFALRTC